MAAVLEQGLKMHAAIDEVAHDFVALVADHLFDPLGPNPSNDELHALAETIERLRPVAATVVSAELARSMEHHVQKVFGSRIGQMLAVVEPDQGAEAS